ncbi:MAG: hypothetical protein ABSG46_03730 [Candidatus Binataceae bacterium]
MLPLPSLIGIDANETWHLVCFIVEKRVGCNGANLDCPTLFTTEKDPRMKELYYSETASDESAIGGGQGTTMKSDMPHKNSQLQNTAMNGFWLDPMTHYPLP